MISLTHFIFGLALAYIFDLRLVTASTFALVPDFDITLDFLYPFVHRGITHTFLAAGVFTLLVYTYTEDRVSALSCFVGYAVAGLGLDLLTSSGVPLFFPLFGDFALNMTSAYSLTANLAIISLSLGLIFAEKEFGVSRNFWNRLG